MKKLPFILLSAITLCTALSIVTAAPVRPGITDHISVAERLTDDLEMLFGGSCMDCTPLLRHSGDRYFTVDNWRLNSDNLMTLRPKAVIP